MLEQRVRPSGGFARVLPLPPQVRARVGASSTTLWRWMPPRALPTPKYTPGGRRVWPAGDRGLGGGARGGACLDHRAVRHEWLGAPGRVLLRGVSTLSAMALLARSTTPPIREPAPAHGLRRLGPQRVLERRQRDARQITKTGDGHAPASSSRRPEATAPPLLWPRVKQVLRGQPAEGGGGGLAAKAQNRLHRRYARLVGKGKKSQLAATAVARELCGSSGAW